MRFALRLWSDCNKDGFKHLQAHVAPTAYATQQEGDAPKCHPNTRMAIIDNIRSWISILFATRVQWALWLYGAAGAGKSAICRSIVDLCLQEQVVIARFFFFRTDSSRNTIDPVVATLLNQLIKQIPGLVSIVIPRIQEDPLIFKQSFETQFETLIYEPIRQLFLEAPFQKAVVILLDGVDECNGDNNQETLIRTLIRLLDLKAVPIIVLFASRTENQIKAQFQLPKAQKITHLLALDNNYRTDKDIRTFLNDSFADICASHPFSHFIPTEWPSPTLVHEIVTKSSGQFIYASVVLKFVSAPRSHPVSQLDIVRGLKPVGTLTPFSQLDALYQHILSSVQDLDLTTLVLAHLIFDPISDCPPTIADNLGISKEMLSLVFADLSSVIEVRIPVPWGTKPQAHFLHASLPDFLLDPTRSGQYYIERAAWSTRILISILLSPDNSHNFPQCT